MCYTLLSAAYPYAAFRQKVVSIVTELKYGGIEFGGDDQSLGHKLVQNGPFVPLQVCAGPIQQNTKDRNFQIREVICADIDPWMCSCSRSVEPKRRIARRLALDDKKSPSTPWPNANRSIQLVETEPRSHSGLRR